MILQAGVSLEHYCRTIAPRAWKDVTVLMLTACFDAAGKKEDKTTPMMVVAGFSSISRVWFEFENRWTSVLGEFDVPYFHAGDFAHCKKPFKHFQGDATAKKQFVSNLLDVIRDSGLRKFGAVLKFKDLAKAKAALNFAHDATVDSYVLCSLSAVDDLYAFARGEGITSNINCVFEKGDPEDLLRRHFKKHDFPDPAFKWSKVVYQKGMRQDPFLGLQAAGWITWEYYLDSCRVFGLSEHEPSEEGRAAFRAFEDIPGHIKLAFASNPLDDVLKRLETSFPRKARSVRDATERLDTIRREGQKEYHGEK